MAPPAPPERVGRPPGPTRVHSVALLMGAFAPSFPNWGERDGAMFCWSVSTVRTFCVGERARDVHGRRRNGRVDRALERHCQCRGRPWRDGRWRATRGKKPEKPEADAPATRRPHATDRPATTVRRPSPDSETGASSALRQERLPRLPLPVPIPSPTVGHVGGGGAFPEHPRC